MIDATKATRIYGASDDLIEFEGGFVGEYGCYGASREEKAVLVFVSDGTVLRIWYGKGNAGIWSVQPLRQGPLFEGVDFCTDEDADPYSDVAKFKPGVTWAYAARNWEEVA